MSENRVFSEQEAADLVLAAVKLQEASATSNHEYTPGITYTELLKIAKDVGVSEDYLRQAMQGHIAPGVADKKKSFLGWPLSYTFERVIDVEIDPDQFDLVASELTHPSMSGAGAMYGPQILGRTITGTTYDKTSQSTIKVSSRNGRTRIENKISSWAAVIPMTTMWIILPFMLVGLRDGRAPAIITSIILSSIVFLLTYLWPQMLAKKHMKLGEERVDRIAKILVDELSNQPGLNRDQLAHSTSTSTVTSSDVELKTHE
ncbi:MAG: hypothetical protein LCH41_07175 [Armatimonadetes bacterium]|nr:hypothetical protein [Armatimonadota bacterium]